MEHFLIPRPKEEEGNKIRIVREGEGEERKEKGEPTDRPRGLNRLKMPRGGKRQGLLSPFAQEFGNYFQKWLNKRTSGKRLYHAGESTVYGNFKRFLFTRKPWSSLLSFFLPPPPRSTCPI